MTLARGPVGRAREPTFPRRLLLIPLTGIERQQLLSGGRCMLFAIHEGVLSSC